jgi:hypothetical protein
VSSDAVQLALLIVNGLLVPGVYLLARALWKLDRRIYRVELKLNVADE